MTDAWAALAIAVAAQGHEQPVQVEHIDQVLTVEWHHKQIRPGDSAVIFSGGVVAKYGVTTLHADKLTLYQSATRKEGLAEGNIVIEDPDADATAETLQFNWLDQTGKATNIMVKVDGLYVKAGDADIKPDVWLLKNAYAAPSSAKRPLFSLKSPDMEYRPGGGGVARKASLSVLGSKLVTLPSYRFGRKGTEYGLRLPSVSYNQGLGIAWNSNFLIDDRSVLAVGGRVKQSDRPGGSFQLTRSLLPRNEPGGLRSPESDIYERFTYGYFDSVYVKRPSEERSEVGARRTNISIGALANGTPVARLSTDAVTKPFEVILEQGDLYRDWGVLTNLRYQSLQQEGTAPGKRANDRRWIASGAVLAPSLSLGGGLATHLRLDTSGYYGRGTSGWGQVQAGLTYNPTRSVRLGGAMVYGSHIGTADFDIDKLFATRAFHGRADFDLGTTRLSLLSKFDFERRKWYDNEVQVSQAVGPLEPFVTFREFPRTVTFGIRLRAEQAFEKLRRRLEPGPNKKIDLP